MVLAALVGSGSRPASVGPGPPVMLGSDVTSHLDKDSIMAIRVFVVDDHELVREGLRAVLQRDGDIEVVGESAGASDGVRGIQATQPDVAVIDVRLPDGDGLDVCRIVRRQAPGVACLLLTSHSNDELLFSAIRADAAGFLSKRSTASQLLRSVRRVAAGESLLDIANDADPADRVGAETPENAGDVLLGILSPQERRLLHHLGEGLTNRQVAQRMNLAEKTVKNYVSNLLRKLDMSSRTEAAVFVTNLRVERVRRSERGGGPDPRP